MTPTEGVPRKAWAQMRFEIAYDLLLDLFIEEMIEQEDDAGRSAVAGKYVWLLSDLRARHGQSA